MLDLGADEEALQKALKSLPVDGFTTKISRVKKSGLDACDFDVILDDAHENHDHDMEYLHGHHEYSHDHEHSHNHEYSHSHEHAHDHVHRGTGDLLHLIDHADMTDHAKEIACKIC